MLYQLSYASPIRTLRRQTIVQSKTKGTLRKALPSIRSKIMERETRIELATNSLEGCDSTIELLPRSNAIPLYDGYTSILFATTPATSVNRKSRPL